VLNQRRPEAPLTKEQLKTEAEAHKEIYQRMLKEGGFDRKKANEILKQSEKTRMEEEKTYATAAEKANIVFRDNDVREVFARKDIKNILQKVGKVTGLKLKGNQVEIVKDPTAKYAHVTELFDEEGKQKGLKIYIDPETLRASHAYKDQKEHPFEKYLLGHELAEGLISQNASDSEAFNRREDIAEWTARLISGVSSTDVHKPGEVEENILKLGKEFANPRLAIKKLRETLKAGRAAEMGEFQRRPRRRV